MDASIQGAIGLATTCSNGSDILLVTAEDHGAGSVLLLVVESTTTITSDPTNTSSYYNCWTRSMVIIVTGSIALKWIGYLSAQK
jgi:hypothetical protein